MFQMKDDALALEEVADKIIGVRMPSVPSVWPSVQAGKVVVVCCLIAGILIAMVWLAIELTDRERSELNYENGEFQEEEVQCLLAC